MELKNILFSFRNESYSEVSKLYENKIISEKDKKFLEILFDNTIISLGSIIDGFNAHKNLSENDFGWFMQLYISQCMRELYDIMQKINNNPNSEVARNITSRNLGDLMMLLEKIIGGEDIKDYLKTALISIESIDADAHNDEEILLSKTAIPLILLNENKVNLENIPKGKLIQIARDNYNNSMQKFLGIFIK
jgi:hypothetical protein